MRRDPWLPRTNRRGGAGGQLDEERQQIDRLGQESAETAIPRLIEVLGGESWYLRERAAEILGAFGPPAAPAVEELVRSGLWFTRAIALRVLGRIASPSSLLLVLDRLGDENRAIAEEAGRALLGFCSRGRAAAVAKLLHGRGTTVRGQALVLLRHIDPEATARLERLLGARELMGPEGSLTPAEEGRVAREVQDGEWQVNWARLAPGDPLPAWETNLMRHLRGAEEV